MSNSLRAPAQGTPRVSAEKNQMSRTHRRSRSGASAELSGEGTREICGRVSATGAMEVNRASASREKSFCAAVRVALAGTLCEFVGVETAQQAIR